MELLVARQFEQLFKLQLILGCLCGRIDHVVLAAAHLGFELRDVALGHLSGRQQLAAAQKELTVGVEKLAVRGFGLAAVQDLHVELRNLFLDGIGLLVGCEFGDLLAVSAVCDVSAVLPAVPDGPRSVDAVATALGGLTA